MNLRGKGTQDFALDDAVKRILVTWSQERDSEVGRLNLQRAVQKLTPAKRQQLIERLAEVSLGLLAVIDYQGHKEG